MSNVSLVSQPPSKDISVASWAKCSRVSHLQEMLTKVRPRISFALGLPSPELFPVKELEQAASAALLEDVSALQYGPPSLQLREHIVEIMRWRGVACSASEVFITSGAQQGLSLLGKLLLGPASSAVCEDYAYTGFLQAVEPLSPKLHTVNTDLSTGIDVDAVEALLVTGESPRFLYTNPTGHNPLGLTMGPNTRCRLAGLSAKSLTIIEDDPYGFLQYGNECIALKAIEPNRIIYVGSFSKILSPALRVGWLIAPESLHPFLANVKEGSDINTATYSQRVLCRYLNAGTLKEHIKLIRNSYRPRRDLMLEILSHILPPGSRYTKPSAGVFIWVELPEPYDSVRLLERALNDCGVALLPGTAFASVDEPVSARRSLRLNFSYCREEQIEDGLNCLGRILRSWS